MISKKRASILFCIFLHISQNLFAGNFLLKHLTRQTRMLVCDMAGTTISEGGLVYKVLYETMIEKGLEVTPRDIYSFHGVQKKEVLQYFLEKKLSNENPTFYSELEDLNLKFEQPTRFFVVKISTRLILYFVASNQHWQCLHSCHQHRRLIRSM